MTASETPSSTSPLSQVRPGISVAGMLVVVALIGLFVTLCFPWIVQLREIARRTSCQNNLRQLGAALSAYHGTFQHLPCAAVWGSSRLESLALHKSRRVDLFTHANWAQAVLPFAGEERLAATFDFDLPVANSCNEQGRTSRPGLMICSSDPFNTAANSYVLKPNSRDSISFARGNYAINGGSHCFNDGDGSTAYLTGDSASLEMKRSPLQFRWWGNGVAGFNVCFSYDDFENGSSSLVLLDEVRAGVDRDDPRGVWSLGQIGGSVTWGHGVNGDAYGPNNQEPKADDLLDGDLLNKKVGKEFLQEQRMPCVWYVNLNYQATARSAHPGGVNLLLADGASRFVSDRIDPGLWHVMHSRETPRPILNGNLETLIANSYSIPDLQPDPKHSAQSDSKAAPDLENSVGMQFRLIPAGEFAMGLADHGNDFDLPVEAPQHHVIISQAFHLGVYEVTRSQYARVTGDNSGPTTTEQGSQPGDENLPIGDITWNDADKFCKTLSAMPAEQAAGRRYRLPTEAEWEYACRGGSTTPYKWTPERAATDQSGDAAGIKPPLPLNRVGCFPPNGFGLYDMRGNVWEWTADWFDRDYYSRSPERDPLGPNAGYIKVVRGGCWTFIGEGCKLSYPMMPPWKSSPFLGFRIVCECHAPNSTASVTRERN